MSRQQQRPNRSVGTVSRETEPGSRSLLLGMVISLSLLCSWGLGLLVQASSSSGPSAPASLPPPSVPSVQTTEATVNSAAAGIDPLAPPAEPHPDKKPAGSSSVGEDRRAMQGPALDVPREVIAMLDLRKRDLDKREENVRTSEERLTLLKAEIEKLLARHERLVEESEKQRRAVKDKQDKSVADRRAKEEQKAAETRNQHQAQLRKIFESMPPEEAAARIEKMPDRKAVEVLRLLKGKTAGAILSAVRVERAARLTEQLLATQ